MTENSNKPGDKRPWVRFGSEYLLVTVHQNDRGVLAIEDDGSRLISTYRNRRPSGSQSIELLDQVRREYETVVPIVEVIIEYGSEFIGTRQDDLPCLDHTFDGYNHENDIGHAICKIDRPHSNGKLRLFYQ